MNVIEITDDSFETKILKSDKLSLIDFWAPWCTPCRIVSPIVEELAEEFEGRVIFAKMNVDENPQTPGTYVVQSIPNLKLFKNGMVVDEVIGAAPKEHIKSIIEKNLR